MRLTQGRLVLRVVCFMCVSTTVHSHCLLATSCLCVYFVRRERRARGLKRLGVFCYVRSVRIALYDVLNVAQPLPLDDMACSSRHRIMHSASLSLTYRMT